MPTAEDCIALFEAEGVDHAVGGNTPVLLSEPDTVWFIRSGRVEVFSIAVEDGAPVGARHHFFTAGAGDALFGIDLATHGEGQGLLAVGMIGTHLLRLPGARLREHLGDPAFAASFAPLVDRWVLGLSAGVARTIVPHPRADVQIDAGEEVTLQDGQLVRARKGVAWVSHREGASLFIGMEDLVDLPAHALVPVTTSTWLQAAGPLHLTSVDAARAIASEGGWVGLDVFYGTLFRCEFFNTRLAAADELNRLREKAARDARLRQAALGGLVEVLSGRPSGHPDTGIDDPLLAAATAVGAALRTVMKAPPKGREDEKADPLEAIMRASRVRGREVVLKGDWWAHETWPLLAFIEDGMRPVAVLPGRRGFDVLDPATGTRVALTPALAATLAPRAHTFYRSFPDRPLSPLDLLRFGAAGAGWDVARPLLAGLIGGLLAMVPPYFTGLLVDTVIPEAARNQLVQIALILGIVGITTTSLDVVRSLSVLRLETRMSGTVQPAMWDRLLGLPVAFFRRFAAGDLSQRVMAVDTIRSVLSGAATSAVMTGLFSVFLGAQMFYYSWQLGLLGLGLVLVAMAATTLAGYLKLSRQRDVMEIEGRLSALVLQLLTGISKLRVTGSEGRAFAEWARDFAAKKTLALRAGRIENRLAIFGAVFPVLSSILIFYLLIDYVMGPDTTVTAGAFIAFNAAFGSFLGQMLQLSSTAMSLLIVVPLHERSRPILDALPEVDDDKADPGDLTGRIDVDHLSFRYTEDGPLVLDDVSLQIAAGDYVAIVGPSGSGKSTLLRLLLGLDVPGSGSIYYDGRDLSQLNVALLRKRMGVVMQTGKIRAGSIFDNVVGSAPLTLDDAWEAARMAGFDADVREMPMGMQTVLQQGGLTLSGGQRQRLMIARAIVNRPRILVFDEATSALDNHTQAIVAESLQVLHATRIAVAHRLSTIRGADRIYVMDRGRIVQAGSFEELSSQPGLFADLIRRQVA
ncbi:MAG: NHLP bacteriocin export ABC transporter permease/ATPase subunit [Vicinamibacterales bacterium]